MFGDNRAIKKRLHAVEEELEELSLEIGDVKSAIRRLNAKYAVGHRSNVAGNGESKVQKALEELLGGDLVNIAEGKGDKGDA